ncbi:MAG: DUF2202 domain-containing protein, partial [Rubripirellula sp.]
RNPLNDQPGVFAYADYQRLYESLVASGSRSPLDALKVGAKIEEMDIADLRQMLNQTNDQQVRQVLQHLLQGSQNHLRAFASQITRQGASYNAEFLSQADFDQIANSSGQGQQSRRGGNAGGQGFQNRGSGSGSEFQGQSSGGQGRGRQGGGGKGRGR